MSFPPVAVYPLLVKVDGERAAGPDRPSTTPVYRNVWSKNGLPSMGTVATCYDIFQQASFKFSDRPCLGWRPKQDGAAGDYKFLTYSETAERVRAIGSAMTTVGKLTPKARVGVYGPNCPEWMMSMQACNRQSLVCVPIYDTLGDNAVEYILRHAEVALVCACIDKLPELMRAIGKLPGQQVKTVVYWGGALTTVEWPARAKTLGLELHSWDEFLAKGRKMPADPVVPAANDICTIMYTSGTTGDPKGVMTKHSAVVATVCGLYNWCEKSGISLLTNDVFISYLPLAHIFDRVAEETMLYVGASIGYWQGEVAKLMADAQALKPTIFAGVPRVFDRVHSAVMNKLKAGGWFANLLFNWGYAFKMRRLKAGATPLTASPMFDWLLFRKFNAALGGRVRVIVSGGAPMAAKVEEFLKVTMCCAMGQGYGLTETCAASFIQLPNSFNQLGTVGPPQPMCEFKLESIPEMEYNAWADPPFGEVLVKGPQNFAGYYKMEDETKQVLDADGWFHTGDIATLTQEGCLRIVDRKKNIFKLAHGEYIAVEKLENVYKMHPIVDQVWVYGNSFKCSLLAIVVPKEAEIRKAASALMANADTLPLAEVCARKEVLEWATKQLSDYGRAQKLKGFEIVKAVHLEAEQFTLENDLLTPTFKLKRAPLLKKYKAVIDQMYKNCGE